MLSSSLAICFRTAGFMTGSPRFVHGVYQAGCWFAFGLKGNIASPSFQFYDMSVLTPELSGRLRRRNDVRQFVVLLGALGNAIAENLEDLVASI